jgi:hypothetical protein
VGTCTAYTQDRYRFVCFRTCAFADALIFPIRWVGPRQKNVPRRRAGYKRRRTQFCSQIRRLTISRKTKAHVREQASAVSFNNKTSEVLWRTLLPRPVASLVSFYLGRTSAMYFEIDEEFELRDAASFRRGFLLFDAESAVTRTSTSDQCESYYFYRRLRERDLPSFRSILQELRRRQLRSHGSEEAGLVAPPDLGEVWSALRECPTLGSALRLSRKAWTTKGGLASWP